MTRGGGSGRGAGAIISLKKVLHRSMTVVMLINCKKEYSIPRGCDESGNIFNLAGGKNDGKES